MGWRVGEASERAVPREIDSPAAASSGAALLCGRPHWQPGCLWGGQGVGAHRAADCKGKASHPHNLRPRLTSPPQPLSPLYSQVRALFEAAEARKPSIVFIDEVDALTSTRSDNETDASRRLKNELLVRMCGS